MAAEPTIDVEEEDVWNKACALIGPRTREMRFRGSVLYVRQTTRKFAAGGSLSTLRVCARQTRDAVFAIVAPSQANQALECIVYRPPPQQPFTGASRLAVVASSGISLHELDRRTLQATPRNVLRVCLGLLTPDVIRLLVSDAR